MSLKNFGGVLDFAIQVENDDALFLQQAEKSVQNQETRDLLERFIRENTKNAKTLTRARQENVTEMILEPIQGLEAAEYQVETADPGPMKESDILQTISQLEDRAFRFYQEAAQRMKPVSDVAGTFQRLAKKKKQRLQDLEALNEPETGS